MIFRDGDGILDAFDNCPDAANGEQADNDADGVGNVDKTHRQTSNLTLNHCRGVHTAGLRTE